MKKCSFLSEFTNPESRILNRRKIAYQLYVVTRRLARKVPGSGFLRRFFAPVLNRLLYRMYTDNRAPQIVRGHRMYLAPKFRYPPIDMLVDGYEKDATGLFERLVEPGMTVLDIGAHVGYYTLLAARGVGRQGRVHAFEPEPDNFALLQKNIQLNGYGQVSAHQCAVANSNGPARLLISALDTGCHSLYPDSRPKQDSVEIQVTSLDTFLEEAGWPQVDLIKLDVEGSELEVLAGMGRCLRQARDLKMLVEFCPHVLAFRGSRPEALVEALRAHQFQIHILHESGSEALEAVVLQGLVAQLLRDKGHVNLLCVKGSLDPM